MASLFFSYTHKDEVPRDELEIHLATLKRQGLITTWHDRRIIAGQEVDNEISEYLDKAHIILLLISPYFIASKYCYEIEMKRALERHHLGEAIVIPVILEHCDWHPLPFGKLMAIPTDGKPISDFPNRHKAFAEIAASIRKAIESLNLLPPPSASLSAQATRLPSALSPLSSPRSSNLRLKKTFSEYEKDQFLQEAFEYITTYFTNSLSELETRNAHIRTKFNRIDANGFEATIYANGSQSSQCGIRLEKRSSGGSIIYNQGRFSSNAYGKSLTVSDDGYILFLKVGIGSFFPTNQEIQLTFEGGADFFWSALIEYLQ